MFFNIDLGKLLYLFCRNIYSCTREGNLSIFYTYLFCCLFPLQVVIDKFLLERIKWYQISRLKYTYKTVREFFNYYYDNTNNSIEFYYYNSSTAGFLNFLYSEQDLIAPIVYLYSEQDTTAPTIYVNQETIFIDGNGFLIVDIPISLLNDTDNYYKFISDLESVKLAGTTYKIITH